MRKPVKFNRPPVVEVVCGVLFRGLPKLRTPHFGLFWSRIRDRFPLPDERPPLSPAIETFPATPIQQQPDWPITPRVWLLGDEGRHLVQLQGDRFLYNWKSAAPEDGYPSYSKIIVEFGNVFPSSPIF